MGLLIIHPSFSSILIAPIFYSEFYAVIKLDRHKLDNHDYCTPDIYRRLERNYCYCHEYYNPQQSAVGLEHVMQCCHQGCHVDNIYVQFKFNTFM